MLRNFCLNCGSSFTAASDVIAEEGTNPCVCGASSELLTILTVQEQAYLPIYAQAKPLTEGDLERQVLCDGRVVTVAQLIGTAYVGHAIRACLPRVGEREIVQLAYVKHLGSMLFTWPFCNSSSFGGPHRPNRLRATSTRLGLGTPWNPGPCRRDQP
jgi:hypothetical protein